MTLHALTQTPLALFGLTSGAEWAIVLIFIFILFGAKKIPELMRSLGRAQGEYQHAKKQFESELKGQDAAKATATAAGQSPATTPPDAHEETRQRAQALGIDTDGKSQDELDQAIAEQSGDSTP